MDGLRVTSPAAFIRAGVGHVPEDTGTGLAVTATVLDNAILKAVARPPIRRGPFISHPAARATARDLLAAGHLDRIGLRRHASTLSGGQAQRLIVQRELQAGWRALVAAYPTRGLDVGSIEFVHKRIIAARDAGIPVIVVSTELDEVVALADRIAVMYRGGIVGIVPGDTPRDVLGLMMAGETTGAAA